jgi:FMN phosphatase YigB (HAD superfamily)
MPRIIVFDVNETLLDVDALKPHFARAFGDELDINEPDLRAVADRIITIDTPRP